MSCPLCARIVTDESSVCTSDSESVHTPVHPPGLRDDAATSEPDVEDQVKAAETIPMPTLDASDKTVKPLNDVLNDPLLDIDTSAFEEYNYSLSGLPTLDTFIPDDLLPDDLLVHDIDNLTHPQSSQSPPHLPIHYVRILPKTPRESAAAQNAFHGRDPNAHARVAHLYLKHSNTLGTGHHGSVYRAPFRLRLDADSQEERTVSVAVKTAHNECGAHYMLNNEARMYAALPRSFMEDRRVLPEDAESQPADLGGEGDGRAVQKVPEDNGKANVGFDSKVSSESPGSDPPAAACGDGEAALPSDAERPTATEAEAKVEVGAEAKAEVGAEVKIQGGAEAKVDGGAEAKDDVADAGAEKQSEPHDQTGGFEPAVLPKFYGYYAALNADGTPRDDNHSSCGENARCRVLWPTRLLLVEECGAPVTPYYLTRCKREECLALVERLHRAGVLHGSTYARNMLVQPGPLSAPRSERTMGHPSFRLIDLGRSEFSTDSELRTTELRRAKGELYMFHWC
ncbi:hypothetical protein C8Q74DRAFT_967035 [Fomes fomentarius]|nr:hypothetical protein C8Q74DRAFT_967035 [Fomes fomentarius]